MKMQFGGLEYKNRTFPSKTISSNCMISVKAGANQNLLENWDSTRHLLDVSWRYSLKNIFFRSKTFLFFKIESWNFQNLLERAFRETSQNFNSIRQPIETMKITIVWIKQMLKASAFYLEKRKSFNPKEIYFLGRSL